MSEWEYIGLMLTDGMYEEANKKYLTSFNPDFRLKSNIAYILHQADMMATHIESDQWRRGDKVESNKVQMSVDKIKKDTQLITMKLKKSLLNQQNQKIYLTNYLENRKMIGYIILRLISLTLSYVVFNLTRKVERLRNLD